MNFKVIVINLDSSTDRLESISKQCTNLDLPFERISAVRGSALTTAEKSTVYSLKENKRKYDKILNDGEIGCYLSHIRCWEQIVSEQLDFALILEDDAILTEDLPLYISKLASTSSSWDYIKLSRGNRLKSAIATLDIGEGLAIRKELKLPSTCTGQLVSLSGAKKLLNHAYPISRPVDMDIKFWFEKSLRCFVAFPLPVLNGDFSSEINKCADRRLVKKHPVRRLMQLVRYEILLRINRNKLADFPKI